MRIIVTGGSGYLGTHVRQYFGADDFSRRSNLDILSQTDVPLVEAYDVVIHLAAYLDKDPAAAASCFRTNAEGTASILRNMRRGSVFIYASTKDVYGAHAEKYSEVPETCPTDYCGQSALEWSKLIGERYVEYYARQLDLRAAIFRLSTVYAPASTGNEPGFVTHLVESIKQGWPLRLPERGEPVRDLLHVNDFSRACRRFIDSSQVFGLYNVGGGRDNALSLRELVDLAARLLDCETVIDPNADAPAPVPLSYISDLTRITQDLGWQPRIGLEEGLKNLL